MNDSILSLPAPRVDVQIRYGDHAVQFVDVRLPKNADKPPVAIVVHGGFWRDRYDLEHIGHVCAALTRCGIATWNIEYRRLGQTHDWTELFFDVAAAADAVRDHADDLNLDLTRVMTIGHSAGGHLALWLAGRHNIPRSSPLWQKHPLMLCGAISLAGVVDLERAYELQLSQRVVAELLGGSPAEFPERYHATSPAALLPLGVRQIVVHGTNDGPVPFALSEHYVKQSQQAGDDIELIALHGAHHFELIDPTTHEWHAVQHAACHLLGIEARP